MIPISSKVVDVTPAMAAKLLEENLYEYQRPVSQMRVAEYAQMMKDGTFSSNHIDLATVDSLNGLTVMTNGQHTAAAIIASGCTWPLTIIKYRCSDEDDLALLYQTTDIGRRRNMQDQARADKFDVKTGVPLYLVNPLAAAVRFIHNGFQEGHGYGRDLNNLEAIDEMWSWVQPMKGFITLRPDQFIQVRVRRRDCLSVILATFKAKHDLAAEFWGTTLEDDGLRKADPRKQALNFLVQTVNTGVVEGVNKHDFVLYSSRALASCWNAWCEGRELTRILVKDHHAPMKIKHFHPNGKQNDA